MDESSEPRPSSTSTLGIRTLLLICAVALGVLSLVALIRPYSFIEKGGEAFRLNNYTGQVAMIQKKGLTRLPEMPYVEAPIPPAPTEAQPRTFSQKVPLPYNWSVGVRTKLIGSKMYYTFSLSEWTVIDEFLERLEKKPKEADKPKLEDLKKEKIKTLSLINFNKGKNAIILHFKDKDEFVLHRLNIALAQTSRTIDEKDQNKVIALTTHGSFEISKAIAEKIESMSALWALDDPVVATKK